MLPHSCAGGDPCCTSLFDLADSLREVAYQAVKSCGVEAECAELSTFMSVGAPVFAHGDYVAGWIDNFAPGYRPPSERGQNVVVLRTVARVGVILVESGWPTIEGGNTGTVPDPQTIHTASRFSYAHADKMLRAIYAYLVGNRCASFDIGPAQPYVEGNLAGWRIFVDMSWDR